MSDRADGLDYGDFRDALASPLIRPVMFCFLDIYDSNGESTPIRVSNSITMDWGGYTWLGVGSLGTISAIEEGVDLQMYGVNVTLNGIYNDYKYIKSALEGKYQWRKGELYLGLLDESLILIQNPIVVFSGIINNVNIEYGSEVSITVSIESMLTDWQRPRISRFTHEDQITKYPTDMGLEFASSTTEMEIIWGRE